MFQVSSVRAARSLSVAIVLAAAVIASRGNAFAQATKPATAATTTAAFEIGVTCEPASGVATLNQPVVWTFGTGDADGELRYRVKRNNLRIIDDGPLASDGRVHASSAEPCALFVELYRRKDGKDVVVRTAGAMIAPDKLRPATAPPDDFDDFWKTQLRKLTAVPANPQLKPLPSGVDGIDYFDVTLDNVDGKHVHAQLARPAGDAKSPAVVVYQWAGVYPLEKAWVTDLAKQGWLVFNVSAHDLPIAEPKAFYEAQLAGPLKNYAAIGATSRDTSYLRTMLLGDYQAIDYLAHRPDWDGKTLIVRGVSQGGLQSIAIASLYPGVTGLSVLVPAGCETVGRDADRQSGWPYWHTMGDAATRETILQTSRYFDGINFARHVKCPALVGAGLRDRTSPPAGVLSMVNTLGGPEEVVLTLDAGHQSPQPRYRARDVAWMAEQRARTSGK